MPTAGLLVLLLLQTTGSAPPAELGIKALEGQKWAEAVEHFNKAAAAEPKDYSHHFHLGFAWSMLNKEAEAITAYRKALELKPGLYEAQLNLGILLISASEAGQAAELLQAAAGTRPKEFRPNYYLAEALLSAGKAGDAVARFRTALEIDPKSSAAELGLARALARSGQTDEAAAVFRKLGEAQPDAWLELASIYETAGRRTEAIDIYRKFPDNPAVRERLGQLLLEEGKAADALQPLEIAVKESPTRANRYALAMAYLSAGKYAEAEPMFRVLVDEEPGNVQMRANYARALRQQKKIAPAAAEFLKVAQAKPDSAEAWSDVAGMLMLLENYQGAIAALDKVRALGAETAAHHYLRALVYDKHRMYEQALASYQAFLAGSQGKNPDEEFKARQRVRIITKEVSRK